VTAYERVYMNNEREVNPLNRDFTVDANSDEDVKVQKEQDEPFVVEG
jgi:hypothetical protein